jgi:hypothetical protein
MDFCIQTMGAEDATLSSLDLDDPLDLIDAMLFTDLSDFLLVFELVDLVLILDMSLLMLFALLAIPLPSII